MCPLPKFLLTQEMEAGITRVASLLVGPRDPPELPLISRLLEKTDASEGGLFGIVPH